MTPFHLIPQALSAAECESLIALCKAAPMKDAGLVRQTTAHQIRRAEVSWLDDLPEAAWVMGHMMRLVAQANREAFGFDLTEFAESPQVARYGAEREGHFDWHSDIGAGALAAKRKLTIVVSEQVLSFAMDVADRLFVIEGGRLVHETARADTDESRIKSYLSV
jgi:PKHD-type hydroxylase